MSTDKHFKSVADSAVADAQAQIAEANVVLGLDRDAGRSIVQQVQAIDAQVFNAAYKGEPDFATVSSQSKPNLPFSNQSAPLPTPSPGQMAERDWATPINKVINDTNALKTLMGGLATTPPDFKQCITSLDQVIAQVRNAQASVQATPTATPTPTQR